MISLYVHIPFCTSRCSYCSFNTIAIDSSDALIDDYLIALKKEIAHYADVLKDKSLKTLYFGGGTPSKIGSSRLIDIIEYIAGKFDLENLAELSIEVNPYPEEEILEFVQTVNKKYPKISRLRYTFGIQSFDDGVLKAVGRAYDFTRIVDFLRTLTSYKQGNNVFNFDFIAFGKFQVSKTGFKQLRHEFKRDFLQKFLASGYVDSTSLYTLEGIGQENKKIQALGISDEIQTLISSSKSQVPCSPSQEWHGNDEEIMEEFLILKDIIENAGFIRYEISNFAHAGKISIHNMVYRNMENYIGLGLSAASFISGQGLMNTISPSFHGSIVPSSGLRWTNTQSMKKYLEGQRRDEEEVHVLNQSDILIEEFFLRLRTREGLADISKFTSVLVPNYQGLITNYEGAGLVVLNGMRIHLTEEGMYVYNTIVTDLLQRL